MDKVFDAFRICITEGKCTNTDCPYDNQCSEINAFGGRYVQIPKVLALDVLNKLKEPQELVRCKDCRFGSLWSDENVIVCDKLSKTRDKNWFCADGERKET